MEDKKVRSKTRGMAHSRRQKENDTFTDIAEALPIHENAKELDKASILRVAINYLKLRDIVDEREEEVEDEETKKEGEDEQDTHKTETDEAIENSSPSLPNFSKDVLQALDGFMLIISSDGRILYTSETISSYLGLRQVDVIGSHIHDIVHSQDVSELATIFKTNGKDTNQVFDSNDPLRRNFVVRMRCAFTPSVRSITRCSNFKPIYCSAFLKFGKTEKTQGKFQGVVALCKLASVSRIKEMCVGAFFKTKHALDLGYTSIDTRIRWILGYDPSEMVGQKAYQYFHPEDLTATSSCHMNLLSQGHSHSPCYRFMSRWGDWLWVRSKSYVKYNKITHLPDGLLIYTWIVRIEEDDERMRAIKGGEDAEHLTKTYSNLSSSISAEGGSLDISKLADPTLTSVENMASVSTVEESYDSIADIADSFGPVTMSSGMEECPSQVNMLLGNLTPGPTPPPPLSYSSPPPSLSPDPPSSSSSSSFYTHPSTPMAAPSPAESIAYSIVGQYSNNTLCSPPECATIIGQTAQVDQTGFFGSVQQQQSMMPSPPYMPYDSSPPQPPLQFTAPSCPPANNTLNYQGFPPATLDPETEYANQCSAAMPLPLNAQFEPQGVHFDSSSAQFDSYPPAQGQLSSPEDALIDELQLMVDMATQPTQSGGANPNFEFQATVFAPSSGLPALPYESPSLDGLQLPRQDPGAYAGTPAPINAHQKTVDKQYISNARARYSNMAAHGQAGGRGMRSVGGEASDESTNQTRAISQWSQWLQSGGPAPHVC